MEIAANDDAAASRMGSCASWPMKSVKALQKFPETVVILSLKKTDNDSCGF